MVIDKGYLRERVKAPDELRFVVREHFAAIRRKGTLQAFAHRHRVDREHEHLVVREQLLFYRLAKTDAVHFLAVFGDVVHGADFDAVLFRFLLARFAVKARRRRHVEALFRPDKIVVVNLHEIRFVLSRKRRSRRAVRLVTDD